MQKKALKRLNKKSYEPLEEDLKNKGAVYGLNPLVVRRESSPEKSMDAQEVAS